MLPPPTEDHAHAHPTIVLFYISTLRKNNDAGELGVRVHGLQDCGQFTRTPPTVGLARQSQDHRQHRLPQRDRPDQQC